MKYEVTTNNGHMLYEGYSRNYAQKVARNFCKTHNGFTVTIYGNGGWINGKQVEYTKTYKA